MHIHFEKTINAYCDCTILSMSWMGKVPDELPEDEGWKLNRTHYYQEGWLATGNVRGVLGVTYTTSHWKKNPSEVPHRTNYNLRGHRSQITLVQWNEPYQKLASCDSSGIIFVWIKFEGRWSIELINDRNTPVTHFSWSHDGRMALICYQDNFVLVGSVAGQRYWSTLLNLEATITCGIWTPDDQQVYFGTSNGQVVVMDVHGVMLSQVQLPSDSPISSMAWSCEKFKMEESEDGEATSSSNHYCNKRPFLLAVCIKTGGIYLMKSYDDVAPIYVSTGMHGLHIEWSNSGEFLAVAGSRPIEVLHENGNRVKEYSNSLHVYNHQGVRIVNINIPHVLSPVTSMTWGHNDKRIFVATGKLIHVGWVSKRIASLQLLCRLAIYKSLSTETCVSHLPLPLPVRALISSLHTQTIPSLLPNIKDMRDFVSHPPNSNLRLYCTMIRHEEDSNQSPGTAYTLYLEYMGGLIPILKGKRTSKIRPEFVIYDPQAAEERGCGLPFSHGATGDMRNGNGGMVAGSGMGGNGGGGYCCHCNGSHHTYHQQRHSQLPSNAGTEGGSCPGGSYCHPVAICSCSASHFGENGIDNGLADSGIGQNPCHCHCCCHSQHYHHHYQNSSSNKSSSGGGCASVHHGQSSSNFNSSASTTGSSVVSLGFSDSSESEDVELCASPRMQRKRYRNRQRERERLLEREREREWERTRSSVHLLPEPAHPHQLIYNDVLPEANRLVEVTSNIWGTKFKIHGVAPSLPDTLGQVTYKTSLLHLQPRQMTLLITELRDDIFFSPETLLVHGTYADEDEEDLSIVVGGPDASTTAASLRASAQFQNNQQMGGGMQHGAIIVQNGVGMAGNIFRGNAYTGSNVIYHPQGVPRGEDSPPIISTSRCYLQSSSSSSSSSNNQGYSQPHDHHHHHHNSQHNSCSSSSTQGASCSSTSSPLHQRHHHHHQHPGSSNGDCPSSSSVASSSSCCSSNQSVPQYYASSCSSSSKTTPRSSEFTSCHFDVEDQDEFPYVDFTANSDIIQFRETLRNNWNYEQGLSSAMDGNMCQVCEPYPVPASPQIPMKVVGGGTSVGIASCPIEASLFTDRSIQKAKHGLAMEGNGGMYECSSSGGEGMAPDTPTHTSRNPARSLRSPKKVSGRLVGGGSLRMSSYQNNAQVANQDLQPAHRQLRQEPSYSHQHQLPLHLQQQQQMQPVPVTAPMFVRRSISASYLDSVERNLAPSLDIVGNEPGQNSPPKRLILVKKSGKEEGEDSSSNFGFKGKPRLKDWGKSKSWDSCDLSAWKNKNGKAKEVCLDGTLKNGCGPSYASASSYRKDILTSSCPKCRFPSTEPVRRCVTILAEPLVQCRANASSLRTPNTPVRRNTMGTSSNAVASPHLGGGRNSNGRQTPTAGSSSSGEDVIELVGDHPSRPPTPIQSIPLHHASPAPSPPPPVSQSPPPPPSTVHRRSLSLLTPLLRRREMLNAGRQQSSNEGNKQQRDRNSTQGNSQQQSSTNGGSSNNAPHSSSFIPPGSPQHQPRSSPSTPASQRRSRQSYLSSASSPFRQLFINSPLLTRRKSKGGNNNNNNSAGGTNTLGRHQRRKSIIDSSDEEGYFEDGSRSRPQQQQLRNDNLTGSRNNCVICSDMGSPCTHASVPSSSVPCVHNTPFRGEFGGGIETLQKSQQKMGRKKIQCMESCVVNPRRREFLMHNKAPMWNENSQVYQLDFGGRVTQESAKNFQIEFRGKQVMQFGRIDGSAYTLDFQYPFAAVQAFSVALANVTQRLK